ncbi:rhodanese-like domain-containing protein [Geomicrobium sp. JSM 1781026]|uniref:rhodanese-like domain-containing protein n=1 Tax=Geomicrobium sp. JSM 1781026 TaxID=3344580 RepID=UPI0035BEE61E
MRTEEEGIPQWDVEEMKKAVKDEETVIVDIREPDEYEEGHIPGVPLLPMSEVPERIEEMDKEKTHVFICRSGRRSQNVAKFARENGFERVVNFSGGMLTWDGELKTGEEKRIKETKELYRT